MIQRLILLGCLALAGPAAAQSVAPGTADATDTTTTAQPAPAAPARNIMPQTLNHKPNPVKPPPEIAASIDRFFTTLRGDPGAPPNAQDAYEKAYAAFLNGTMLGEQTEKMSIFVSKTQEAFGIYGPLRDYEIFDNYGIGSNVLVLTYLTRHTVQPLRWRFIFYRPDKQWKLINMGFDDVLLDMLD